MAENKNNIRKTINNNLDIVKGTTSTFFTGVDDLISSARMDPIVTGYGFVRVLDVPTWFSEDPDLKNFKTMIEKNTRGFSGVEDIELQSATQQTGFAGHDMNIITGIQRGNTNFTLTHKEYSGSPMRKLYQKYISYVRDPRTGLAMYPSIFNVEYGARNHTFSILMMSVRPDANNKTSDNVIEYAAFYSNAYPTTVPLSELYNWEHGTQDSPTLSMNWVGMPEIGPDVDALALKVLREEILNTSENGDGIPFLDMYGMKSDVTGLQKNGWLSKIYNPNK